MVDHKDNEQPEQPAGSPTGSPPRKWLMDRINGKSKVGDAHPPFSMCYVPPPVGWCPGVMEDNKFCMWYGKLGLVPSESDKWRTWIFRVGFLANLAAFVFTVIACLAISKNYDVLKGASYSSAVVSDFLPIGGEALSDQAEIKMELGLRSIAIVRPVYEKPLVISFDEFCDIPSDSIESFLTSGSETSCDDCNEVSKSLVLSVIFSVITFIPSFSTDILRMYSNYDVNCQKFMSSAFAVIAVILSLNTLIQYNQSCFENFYSGTLPLDENFEPIDDDTAAGDASYTVNFDWSPGAGLICLYLGTILKAVDILANLLVPSPRMARDDKLKQEYENLPDDDVEA